MMILLMENAAGGAVTRGLDPGDATVGTAVNVKHLAATPLGQQVRAFAELIKIEGRRLGFKVEAYDEHKTLVLAFAYLFILIVGLNFKDQAASFDLDQLSYDTDQF